MFFADAFNCLLYDGEQTIKPEELQKPDTAEMTVPYGNNARVPVRKPRDLLKTWNAMMDDNAIQVILGAELQDWVRYGMPVKDGRYDMPGCLRQTAEIKRSSRKEDVSEEGEITADHGVPKIRLTSGELYQACGKTISRFRLSLRLCISQTGREERPGRCFSRQAIAGDSFAGRGFFLDVCVLFAYNKSDGVPGCTTAKICAPIHDAILMITEEERLKKRLLHLALMGAMGLGLTAFGGESETAGHAEPARSAAGAEGAGKAPDYSKAECWYRLPEITKDVDTFYIYSTMYGGTNEGDPEFAPLDNAVVLESIGIEHAIKSSVFEDSTNLFIPFYRQAGIAFVIRKMAETGNIESAMSGTPYDDVTAALDYYFENYNEGRPFVIAGHSQGAAILRLVLQGYFREHPEYYKRMVAAYAIGYSVTKEYLESNPHLKFATGESDTGVIISWNAEGPKNVEENAANALVLPNAISINPLNWKLDETYAPASRNLGSMVMDAKTGKAGIRDINGDAQVNLARGTVITNADAVPNDMQEYTGPQSYHQDDYSIFYNNIKDNVAKRIAAYQSKQ